MPEWRSTSRSEVSASLAASSFSSSSKMGVSTNKGPALLNVDILMSDELSGLVNRLLSSSTGVLSPSTKAKFETTGVLSESDPGGTYSSLSGSMK
ncbi:hypothetical protein OGAPHI_006578 [Ogataea philodendri]|uniref:Uncharacterized protein n=1 Tax=Ogataea philodendri TaxID=1378263 RepID=A0A9P8T086_9ASCO|nr:uncharacterized protein OGAPHI_006578 [Ogataea philodendri]KAH3661171.1 hypothetical protein OGAPHI_006578 [Ogataea philodendri]